MDDIEEEREGASESANGRDLGRFPSEKDIGLGHTSLRSIGSSLLTGVVDASRMSAIRRFSLVPLRAP